MFFTWVVTAPFGKKSKGLSMDNTVINYIGTSMFPTLKTGDFFRVVSYKERAVRIGDVVLFNSPYSRIPIVHRVVSIDKKGVRTKGDNKLAIDDCILQPNDIIGQVVSAQRGKKKIKILSGFPGRIYASTLDVGKRMDIVVSTILRPVYRWLTQTGIFRKLFSRWIRTQVLCFKHGDDMEMQLHLGRRIIGRRFPGQDRW
jgi:signal peptidase I